MGALSIGVRVHLPVALDDVVAELTEDLVVARAARDVVVAPEVRVGSHSTASLWSSSVMRYCAPPFGSCCIAPVTCAWPSVPFGMLVP